MNKNIKSIVVLFSICLVVAVLLAAVNYITDPIIKKNALLAEQASLRVVLEGAEEFEELSLGEGTPATVTGLYKEINGLGYVVTVSTSSSYSQSPMTFTVGVTAGGKIADIEITNYSETKNFEDYPDSFKGLGGSEINGVDVFSGVTYSSEAFKTALSDALTTVEEVAAK
ncbi:MAG: FMN-binding protein [Clostridia bacterium]|nr:FMN-binding protein [Clostridia bacterium]